MVVEDSYNINEIEGNFEYSFCIQPLCHKFEIKDSFGDGIEAQFGSGYNLIVDGEIISLSFDVFNGDFDFSESVIFGCPPTLNPAPILC